MFKNRKSLWWMGGTLAALLACVSLSMAQGPGGSLGFGPHRGPQGMRGALGPMERMMMGHAGRMMVLRSNLNVTPDQHEQLFDIMHSHRGEAEPLAKGLASSVKNLRDKVISEKPVESEIRAAADELGKAIGDAAVLASKGVGEARTVMTPEQLALIKQLIADEDQAHEKFAEEMKKLPDFKRPK